MEIVRHNAKILDDISHEIYCDECGIHLGTSIEYDDGYYEDFGKVTHSFFMNGSWHNFEKHLCDVCKIELENKILSAFTQLGSN